MKTNRCIAGFRRRQAHFSSLSCACLLVGLLIGGAGMADQPAPASSENSYALHQGPPPGIRGTDGFLGLDPWTVISPTPVSVSRPGGAFYDGLFYVIGGEQPGGVRNGYVQIYDPDTDDWDETSADQMSTPASNLCAAEADGLIYVPGGWTGSSPPLTELQIFNPATGTWTTAATDPMPSPRFGAACTGYQGRLYVFGGYDGSSPTATAWVYDPTQLPGSRWLTLASSSFSHAYASAVTASNGLLFVAGASDGTGGNLANVAAYDPATNSWTDYPGLQTARGAAAVWTLQDRLYVGAGGWSTYLTSVESYDLTQGATGTWEFTSSLNAGRRTQAAATDPVTGELFIAGGWSSGGYMNSAETTFSPGLGPAPSLTSVNPNSGPTAGGTAVTITGSDFVAGATVEFGGNACGNVNVARATEITCDTPAAAAGLVDVTVENPDGQSNTLTDGFTYVAPPSVTSVNPNSGPTAGGTAVTISGANFDAGATVEFGGNACANANVASATEITCDTPAGAAGAVDVSVENPDGQSDTLTDGFTYVSPPEILGIAPDFGDMFGGYTVTITGEDFQSGATVMFGGSACTDVVVTVPDTITCTVPPGPIGPVDVTVTNPDGQSDTLFAGFTYLAPRPVPTLGLFGMLVLVLTVLLLAMRSARRAA